MSYLAPRMTLWQDSSTPSHLMVTSLKVPVSSRKLKSDESFSEQILPLDLGFIWTQRLNEMSSSQFLGHCSTHPRGRLAGLLHILPVDGDLAQDRQLVLGGDLVVLRVEPQQTEQTNCRLYAGLKYLTYLCGINLAASKPNIGLPICVSDSLMDFFFRKTFSPLADTTLNSILPEKVAVNDLERKFIQAHKRKAISSQMWRG